MPKPDQEFERRLIVVCADIGSVAKGNFGWWSSSGSDGSTPSTLAKHVAESLNLGLPVALGFECPLFVPLVDDEQRLTSARPGEGSRPWSAGAGCGALATGLVQVTWILREIRSSLESLQPSHFSWTEFVAGNGGLFLWEAFVSGNAKRGSHTADAKAGAMAFSAALHELEAANAVVCTSPVHSLVGAALLRTGWSSDITLLEKPSLVIRAVPD